MPRAVRFQKEDIVNAAMNIVREKGMDAVTAREIAKQMKVSVGPIFTWFETMEQLKAEIYVQARQKYREYIEQGLQGEIPFREVGRQYIRFAKDEPELYKLLFLTKPDSAAGGAMDALKLSQDLSRESIMRIYRMDAETADNYFRDVWLVAFSFATLIVTDECPYTDEEIGSVLTEISLAVCKAYKEIPGLPQGRYDRDAAFRKLVEK